MDFTCEKMDQDHDVVSPVSVTKFASLAQPENN